MKPPSPVNRTTGRPGAATPAPMASCRPSPMAQRLRIHIAKIYWSYLEELASHVMRKATSVHRTILWRQWKSLWKKHFLTNESQSFSFSNFEMQWIVLLILNFFYFASLKLPMNILTKNNGPHCTIFPIPAIESQQQSRYFCHEKWSESKNNDREIQDFAVVTLFCKPRITSNVFKIHDVVTP